VKLYAISRAPLGAPAPFLVEEFEVGAGQRVRRGTQTFAASLEQARDVVPAGMECKLPTKSRSESEMLVETWEPRKT
jgi:hypothetical protein